MLLKKVSPWVQWGPAVRVQLSTPVSSIVSEGRMSKVTRNRVPSSPAVSSFVTTTRLVSESVNDSIDTEQRDGINWRSEFISYIEGRFNISSLFSKNSDGKSRDNDGNSRKKNYQTNYYGDIELIQYSGECEFSFNTFHYSP